MTERDCFMARIIENPADDAPRLIFADWLEEQGESERAEFIRVQIALSRIPNIEITNAEQGKFTVHMQPQAVQKLADEGRLFDPEFIREGHRKSEPLRQRERELLCAHHLEWRPDCSFGIQCRIELSYFRRGFVADVELPCSSWLTHGEQLLRSAPLERVTLTQAAIGGVRRESDMLVCPVFSWVHGSISLTLQVRNGELWYWMEPDRAGDWFGVRIFAVEGDIPAPRWASIEDSFRAYWNQLLAERYAGDVQRGLLTINEMRLLMRQEVLLDLSV